MSHDQQIENEATIKRLEIFCRSYVFILSVTEIAEYLFNNFPNHIIIIPHFNYRGLNSEYSEIRDEDKLIDLNVSWEIFRSEYYSSIKNLKGDELEQLTYNMGPTESEFSGTFFELSQFIDSQVQKFHNICNIRNQSLDNIGSVNVTRITVNFLGIKVNNINETEI
jgi:hypothetical protein